LRFVTTSEKPEFGDPCIHLPKRGSLPSSDQRTEQQTLHSIVTRACTALAEAPLPRYLGDMMRRVYVGWWVMGVAVACRDATPPEAQKPEDDEASGGAPVAGAPSDRAEVEALLARARGLFGTPEPESTTEDPEVEAIRVELGRMLYYEPRLSKNHDLSCNSCHDLANYGVDVRTRDGERIATSIGHDGVFGDRNSPTTFNAFLHIAQFWDGRAEDVEEQAKGPVLNPVEMAMPDADYAVKVLRSIPGYRAKFRRAFPNAEEPITYDHFAEAIGAFERKLITPAPIDDFLAGDTEAISDEQLEGLDLFVERCASCHMGEGFGGSIYQKLGLLEPYDTDDKGRYRVTGEEDDEYVFKVPSLRNITETAPYLHDGSVDRLERMVSIMAEHQTPQGKLSDEELSRVLAFLDSLTGTIPEKLIAKPDLPESGEHTPSPDPT